MNCSSPQQLFQIGGMAGEVSCGICGGCIRVIKQTNRERQMAWYRRMKGRNAHV